MLDGDWRRFSTHPIHSHYSDLKTGNIVFFVKKKQNEKLKRIHK